MVAGEDSRPAITRRSSPSWSPEKRSTMRYCMGLASGTWSLGEQLVHDRHGFRRVPLALAEGLVSHAPLRVDDERHRQAAHLPAPGRILVAIEDHRKLDELAIEERLDALGLLAEVDRDHLDLSRTRPLQALERRELLAARLAPRGPEIHDDHAAAQPLEIERPPLEVG